MSLKANLITKILNLGITVSLASVLLVSSLNINTFSQSVSTIKIKQDRTVPINVAFKYGDQQNSVKISKVAVTAVLSNLQNTATAQAFELTSASDIFAGDPSAENDKPAAPSSCYNFPEGTSYGISPTLVSPTKLSNYGPQSAKLVDGGAQISALSANRTGCINLVIKVSPSAKVGDKTSIMFNQDALSSPDYSSKPAIQQVILEIEAADIVAQATPTPAVQVTPTPTTATPEVVQVKPTPVPVAQVVATKPATIISTARTGSAELVSYTLISIMSVTILYFVARRFIPKFNI
ncbi:MAG: hypothetical protein H7230_00915 [Candidatus Parcubacteria bacterium]|nr:hypothetical protein [Candidatus Paceibacterota bacterium]